MPATTHAPRSALPLGSALARRVALRPAALGAWALGFALVAYLGFEGGGYDVVVRSQVGIALWWIVGLGALAGVLGARSLGLPLAVAIALLAALAGWTMLSATWSESGEGAVGEAARTITLLGAFTLAAAGIRGRHRGALLNGIVGGIVLVAAVACLSRLHPAWFGPNETAEFLASAQSRLSYGLNYWNALAALVAVGLPLTLAVALRARTVAGRALACSAAPVLALTAFLTLSRGGMAAAVAGLAVAFALTPERLRWLGNAALGAAGGAILIAGALQRDELRDGLRNAVARDQGDELLLLTLAVVAGVALVRAGAALAGRGGLLDVLERLPWRAAAVGRERRGADPRQRRRATGPLRAGAAAVIAAAVLVPAIAFDVPGRALDGWESFKAPPGSVEVGHTTSRLDTVAGLGRYQYWEGAYDAYLTDSLRGIGAGGFETWWAREATVPGTIRNAHSLYMETLGELGLVGIVLLGGLFLLILGVGAARALGGERGERTRVAGATGACVAFMVAASADWTWQVTVVPLAFLLVAVLVLGPPRTRRARRPRLQRGLLAGAAVLAFAALVPTLGGSVQLRQSQDAVAAGQLAPALAHAESAAESQPYPFTPDLQRAMVLKRDGRLAAAAGAARAAERREPTNWRAPFVLAGIEAQRGRPRAAVAAYRRAKALNKTASFLR